MTTSVETIPGYIAGAWTIDQVHSDVSFSVRHLGIAKVRGRFDSFEGTIVTAENPLESSVNATIETASVNSNNTMRDDHIRNEDFLDAAGHPKLTFASTGIRAESPVVYQVDGNLTLRGVTKPVTLELELNGFGTGFDGSPIAGFTATTEISRGDFGITGGPAGAAVGDKIAIILEIEAKQA
ncbi:YceI family protein [Embleya sp. NBC_00896]|uniref:YceI family protein n=1 Tax=Embleya sp. NBC_00896 TaxID=2975961 RepID=UPI002F91847F|nr:YceI family protein [Embleya sp. NBC_00896]